MGEGEWVHGKDIQASVMRSLGVPWGSWEGITEWDEGGPGGQICESGKCRSREPGGRGVEEDPFKGAQGQSWAK